MRALRFLILILLWSAVGLAVAEEWPAWRGPAGQGHCAEKGLPLHWSPTKNVKWKVELEAPGNSTPIIAAGKVFLTQANRGGTVRSLLCLDRATGQQLWRRDVRYSEKERNWDPHWYCNASPVTDGQRVVVSFASAGLYCYNTSGNELWKRTDLGRFEHQYGNGSSPVLYGGLAILWCGPNEAAGGRNFLLAVDKETGRTVWEHDEPGGSWGTPLITTVDGRDQLILGVPQRLKGFDPRTGKELWFCEGLTDLVYTSALYGNGVAVSMSGYGGAALAVRLGGRGDITKDRLWRHPKNTQRVGSGVIVREHVYLLEENGVPHCYELETGKEVWGVEARAGGSSWSSMVAADGRLYVLTKQGETLVLEAALKFRVLAKNALRESTNASLAISDRELFIRTDKHLWCIREAE